MNEQVTAATLFTIGFTHKSAETFFTLLRQAGVERVLDIRLNNVSQLAGFTKRDDLRFFLAEICKAGYQHVPECAPTQEILANYKKHKGSWETYVGSFLPLIRERHIEKILTPALLNHACLLCSEALPDKCHRRLVAEFMKERLPTLRIVHL
jgi:uncharacterized protein (DUF488 family)